MAKRRVSLQGDEGQHLRWITLDEARHLESQGSAHVASGPLDAQVVFKVGPAPSPSNSEATRYAALTAADAVLLSQIKRNHIDLERMHPEKAKRVERLIGHKLLPMPAGAR